MQTCLPVCALAYDPKTGYDLLEQRRHLAGSLAVWLVFLRRHAGCYAVVQCHPLPDHLPGDLSTALRQNTTRLIGGQTIVRRLIDDAKHRTAGDLGKVQRRQDTIEVKGRGPHRHQHQVGSAHGVQRRLVGVRWCVDYD